MIIPILLLVSLLMNNSDKSIRILYLHHVSECLLYFYSWWQLFQTWTKITQSWTNHHMIIFPSRNTMQIIINIWVVYPFLQNRKLLVDTLQAGAYLRVHSTCRVLNSWHPTVVCWIIVEFFCHTLTFADFLSKQTNLSSIQDNLARNP